MTKIYMTSYIQCRQKESFRIFRTNILLENVCEGVGPAYFYTCTWQCIKSNSPVRLPAISYVLSHYSRKISMEDQLYLMGNDVDIMVFISTFNTFQFFFCFLLLF